MRERQSRMIRKVGVQLRRWIFRRAQRSRLQEHDASPRSDREHNEGEKNHDGPEESYQRAIRIHDLRWLLLCIRRQPSIYNREGLQRLGELTVQEGSPILRIRVAGWILAWLGSMDNQRLARTCPLTTARGPQ